MTQNKAAAWWMGIDPQMSDVPELGRRLRKDIRRLPRDTQLALMRTGSILKAWDKGRYRLGRLPHSMAHKLLQAAQDSRVTFCRDEKGNNACHIDFIPRLKRAVPFVIEHDWTAAFANATDFSEGDFCLPFDDTIFEMRADDRYVGLLYSGDGERLLILQDGEDWFVTSSPSDSAGWMEKLVRSACIALDAEIAVTEAVRASEKLNRARDSKGKLPLLDYHVIRLTKRSRVAPLPDEERGESGRHTRLHFVRGHWRHYETHKTWIKWHLRGDPDLGFIDKHYRL